MQNLLLVERDDIVQFDNLDDRCGAIAYLINRNGMKAIIDKYYDKGAKTVYLYGSKCASDFILYNIPNAYISRVPLFFSKDDMFKSCISDELNPVGTNYQKRVHMYYNYYIKNQ